MPILKNDGVRQLGRMTSHILWKNKSHVPNHEPDNIYIMTYRDGNLGIYDEADPKCKIAIIIVFF